jgi:hypothetical protein
LRLRKLRADLFGIGLSYSNKLGSLAADGREGGDGRVGIRGYQSRFVGKGLDKDPEMSVSVDIYPNCRY